MEFVLGELRSNPALSYAEVRARAQLNGFAVFPIVYGRAKSLLGLATAKSPTTHHENSSEAEIATAASAPETVKPVLPLEDAMPAKATETPRTGRGRQLGPEMQFVIGLLDKNPAMSTKDIRAAAGAAGFAAGPQTLARARARVGLNRPRPQAVDKPSPTPERTVQQQRPRSPDRTPTSTLDLHSLVESIRALEQERNQLRDAAQRVLEVLEAALPDSR